MARTINAKPHQWNVRIWDTTTEEPKVIDVIGFDKEEKARAYAERAAKTATDHIDIIEYRTIYLQENYDDIPGVGYWRIDHDDDRVYDI